MTPICRALSGGNATMGSARFGTIDDAGPHRTRPHRNKGNTGPPPSIEGFLSPPAVQKAFSAGNSKVSPCVRFNAMGRWRGEEAAQPRSHGTVSVKPSGAGQSVELARSSGQARHGFSAARERDKATAVQCCYPSCYPRPRPSRRPSRNRGPSEPMVACGFADCNGPPVAMVRLIFSSER